MKVVLATKNLHKIKEILEIWGEVSFQVLTLKDFENFPSVEENGSTFAENALKKARAVAEFTQLISISDDSGIEVEGLQGFPGIYSARYAGEGASDEENNQKLMQALKDYPLNSPARQARFRCVAALVDPQGFEMSTEGIVEGKILETPQGKEGFGYDPLFWREKEQKTTAALSAHEKHAISHRGQAFRKIKEILLNKLSI